MTVAKYLLPIMAAALLSACGPDQRFSRLEKRVKHSLPHLKLSNLSWPEDLTPEQLETLEAFLGQASADLSDISAQALAPHRQVEYFQLEKELTEALRHTAAWRKDPSIYNLPGHWKVMLSRQSAPLTKRIEQIASQFPQTEAYYARARAKIRQPEAHQARLAIDKHVLGIAFLEGELQDSIRNARLSPRQLQELKQGISQTELVLKDYIAWCNSQAFEIEAKAPKGHPANSRQ